MRIARFFFALTLTSGLSSMVACGASNGDAIPSTVYDASPLDAGQNVPDPRADSGNDAAAPKDAASDVTHDAAALPDISISEIYVDTRLLGAGTEFVELRAAPGTSLDELRLRIIDKAGAVKYEVPVANLGKTVGPTGFWVVGGNQTFKLNVTDRVDQVVNLSSWGLDDVGAVQLVRGTSLIDVVGYSTDADAGAAALAPAATPPAAVVEGSPARVPVDNGGQFAARKSFGRKAGAPDTNDNRADFCGMSASPGFEQKACD